MYKNKNILAIIPARKGSKSIKNKNLVEINGKKIIEIAIESAKKSKLISEIVVTTDDKKIINIAKDKKIKFIKRKKNLSGDNSLMFNVINDVLKYYKNFEYILILQVTNPFRSSKMIDDAIRKIINSKADTLISVTKVDDNHPSRMYYKKNKFLKPIDKKNQAYNRQNLKKIFHRNGMIYLFKRENLKKFKSFYGVKIFPFIQEKKFSLNIDSYFDYQIAKLYYENNKS